MNDEYRITKQNILSTLPPVLANDKYMAGLADGISDELAKQTKDIDLIKIYTAIDKLPEELCDILARDFKIDWYGYNYPLEIKRRQIKSNFIVHKHLGTVGAVKRAISDIYPGSLVQEWFEYKGRPYYFRIILDVTHQITQNIADPSLRKALNIYKPLRARLEDDAIIYRSRHHFLLKTRTGYAPYTVRRTGTYPVIATQGQILDGHFIFGTAAHGVAYAVPRADTTVNGTWPNIATQGQIVDGNVIVHTHGEGGAYAVPFLKTIETGTHPVIATQGAISESDVQVHTDAGNSTYATPSTGTVPVIATQGAIVDENVVMETAAESYTYSSPAAKTIDTGSYPSASTQGAISENGVAVHTAGHEGTYSSPSAGTTPVTATQGAIDSSTNITISHDSAVDAQPATNTVEDGTYPATATEGGVDEAGLVAVTEDSGGISYDIDFCGPDKIF